MNFVEISQLSRRQAVWGVSIFVENDKDEIAWLTDEKIWGMMQLRKRFSKTLPKIRNGGLYGLL